MHMHAIPTTGLALTGLLMCSNALACDTILPSQQTVIVAPGKYCLSVNRTLPIEIDSANVELDCRGRSIVATPGSGVNGVFARSADKVTVRNCRVENFDRGIRLIVRTSGQVINNTVVGSSETPLIVESVPYPEPAQQTEPSRVVGNRVIGYVNGNYVGGAAAIRVTSLPGVVISNNVVAGYGGFMGLAVFQANDAQVIGNQFLDFKRSSELIGVYDSLRARVIHNTILSEPGRVTTGLAINRIDAGATCLENVFINVHTSGFNRCAVTRYNVDGPGSSSGPWDP